MRQYFTICNLILLISVATFLRCAEEEEKETSERGYQPFDPSQTQTGQWQNYNGQSSALYKPFISPADLNLNGREADIPIVDLESYIYTATNLIIERTDRFNGLSVGPDVAISEDATQTAEEETTSNLDTYTQTFDACLQKSFAGMTVSAVSSELSLSYKVDIGDCLEEALSEIFTPPIGAEFSESFAHFFLYYQCLDEDLSDFNGELLSEFFTEQNADRACEEMVSYAKNVQYYYEIQLKNRINNEHLGNYIYSIKLADMDQDGFSCQFALDASDVLQIENGCTGSELVEVVSLFQGTQSNTSRNLIQYQSDDLEVSDAVGTWWSGGKVQFTYNDWSGKISFTDRTTLPAFDLSNDSASLSGDYGQNLDLTSLELTQRISKQNNYRGAIQKRLAIDIQGIFHDAYYRGGRSLLELLSTIGNSED